MTTLTLAGTPVGEGCLVGVVAEGGFDCVRLLPGTQASDVDHIRDLLPAGLDVCGFLASLPSAPATAGRLPVLRMNSDLQVNGPADMQVVIRPESDVTRSLVWFRTVYEWSIVLSATETAAQVEQVAAGVQAFEQLFQHPDFAFLLTAGDCQALCRRDPGDAAQTVHAALRLAEPESVPLSHSVPIDVTLLAPLSPPSALQLHSETLTAPVTLFRVRVEALTLCGRHTPLARLFPLLLASVQRQLRQTVQWLRREPHAVLAERSGLQWRNFWPRAVLAWPVQLLAFGARRQAIHSILHLPRRPLFRRSCALSFSAARFEVFPLISSKLAAGIPATDRPALTERSSLGTGAATSSPTPLVNVHLSVTAPAAMEAHCVRGDYYYYHYMQDRVDDKGWGCAYRSLQTLFSWFRLQGFTQARVPSHTEIQRTLVNIGDKPASFVGSREWIGAVEVGFVLDTVLGVQARILSLRSGSEFSDHYDALAAHFDTFGTPVMIGGGVLAYTLLGVARGDAGVRFLILDPHYIGPDDVRTVVQKRWVAWHGPDLFRADAHYNLCMPMVPEAV